jgi:tetratricopeptide (TPR) repeat protein
VLIGVLLARNLLVGMARRGKRAEGEEQDRKALALDEKLVADFPDVPAYRRDLARCHNALGNLLQDLGKRAEVEEQFRKALALNEKLVADFPGVPAYRVGLGGSYCNKGGLVLAGGKPADSLAWFQKAIDSLRPVHEEEPQDVDAKEFLRNSHGNRAHAYDRLERFVDAVKEWDRAVELSKEPEQPWMRVLRANSKVRAGLVAEAVAEVAELTKSPSWFAGKWYNSACVYAIASGKSADRKMEYADRAMECLRNAVKAGFKNAATLKQVKDFDALRDRADFGQLLTELEKTTAPKK